MQVKISQVQDFGGFARLVRKHQSLDQMSIASMSENGTTFLSDFENGKSSVELGRVLKVFEALGIQVNLELPLEGTELTATQKHQLQSILRGETP